MIHWPLTDRWLQCYPDVPEHISLPWDAADEYLYQTADPTLTTLAFNDRHGALACVIPQLISVCDSASAIKARELNLKANYPDREANEAPVSADQVDFTSIQQVLIKIPKNLDLLKSWLSTCQKNLPDTVPIYLAGMAKHIPVPWLNFLEKNSREYLQHRIVKKARLISLRAPTIPAQAEHGYSHQGLTLKALPGVFSANKLDIGSRALLPHLSLIDGGTVCDLGCGNGLLGLLIKSQKPESSLILTDDSYIAVTTARHNAKRNQLEIDVRHGNSLESVNEALDWVVCNPPYHDGHKELTNIAMAMFRDSQRQLKPTGKLLVVANRHLPYQAELKRLFQSVGIIEQTPKFTISLCSQPKPCNSPQ